MAKTRLALKELTVLQLMQLTDTITGRMTGNANFTTPSPTLVEIQAWRDSVDTTNNAAEAARSISVQRTQERDTAVATLESGLTALGSYVDNKAQGDEAKIRSSGMDVRADGAPVGTLPQVSNLTVTTGDQDGELDPSWDRIKGARVYEVQTSADPFSATSWLTRASVTASKATLMNLPSGTKVWVRVRAIGTAGPGPWSDPAIKTVP
ncbi:MAG: fibronectin type III domain-containing protein [Verrucomicrobia bacterium]|nr:fibronectin type III domain-containing protein [Verrucomicrobiota bacterium]